MTDPLNPEFRPAAAAGSAELVRRIREQVGRVFLGQAGVLDQVIAALLAGGHVLLEGKPGLGKTQLVLALARTFGGGFRRIQFTPDLMPSDVTGFTMFDMPTQTFQVRRGPVFTNLLLADEINRAPAKTQAALLEVMQERQVTIDGESHQLPPPFMTLATQNPIEHEGTYPLPEAQLDRFLMKVLIDYPAGEEEREIVRRASCAGDLLGARQLEVISTPEQIVRAQQETLALRVDPSVIEYAVALVAATRESRALALGAGTRGGISLVRTAKAFALLAGRDFVIPDDVKEAALPVLRHRVQLTPEVTISGQDVDEVLAGVVESVAAPRT
jgi:MoxR-like ATPase